jgi:hypothetical protein
MYVRAHHKSGLTLIETTLVVATIALLVGFGIPAVRSLMHSFQTESGTRSMIKAALSSAQAMALSRQRYVGVRFQMRCTSNDPASPLGRLLDASQYMIFIMHDPSTRSTDLAHGFRSVEGMDPVRLPDTVGVMDLTRIKTDADIDEPAELSDATTFSIIFSPSGKLVVEDVRVRNRDGFLDSTSDANVSTDDIFNKKAQVDAGIGMFYQDDYFGASWSAYPNLGLGQEASGTSFVLYERGTFRPAYERKTAWTDYLAALSSQTLYVSPYTGDLISSK